MRVPAACALRVQRAAGLAARRDAGIGYRSNRTRNPEHAVQDDHQRARKDIVKGGHCPQVHRDQRRRGDWRLVGSPDHVFVDLRDGIRNRPKRASSLGAVASSRGMLEFHIDPDSPAHKPEFNQATRPTCFTALLAGARPWPRRSPWIWGCRPLVNLTGGVGAWKKAGGVLE